jgi:hypothetical protein
MGMLIVRVTKRRDDRSHGPENPGNVSEGGTHEIRRGHRRRGSGWIGVGKPGRITLTRPTFRTTSGSATRASPKPRIHATTGPCAAPSPRRKARSTWRKAR